MACAHLPTLAQAHPLSLSATHLYPLTLTPNSHPILTPSPPNSHPHPNSHPPRSSLLGRPIGPRGPLPLCPLFPSLFGTDEDIDGMENSAERKERRLRKKQAQRDVLQWLCRAAPGLFAVTTVLGGWGETGGGMGAGAGAGAGCGCGVQVRVRVQVAVRGGSGGMGGGASVTNADASASPAIDVDSSVCLLSQSGLDFLKRFVEVGAGEGAQCGGGVGVGAGFVGGGVPDAGTVAHCGITRRRVRVWGVGWWGWVGW